MSSKLISLVLIFTQLSFTFALSASADSVTLSSTTPETDLLVTAVTLQGLKLSDSDAESELNAAITRYDSEAPADGRQERLGQALVDLGIYSPAQAQAFIQDAQAAQDRFDAQEIASADQGKELLAAEMNSLAGMHPAGAQFSGQCAVGLVPFVGGLATTIVGLALRFYNPTCHGNGVYYPCTQSDCSGLHGGCYTIHTECEETVCDKPGYYPHSATGDKLLIAGGIATAVGALIAFLGPDACQK